jgi:archaellum biogenesis ATPase FlaH
MSTTTTSRFKIYDVEEALMQQSPVEWIVEDVIEAGTLIVLSGAGGTKKTLSMLDLAVCVALGKDWLNYKTQQSNVLFIDEESGERSLKRRVKKVVSGHGADANLPFYFTTMGRLNLFSNRKKDKAELLSLILQVNANLVIIDAFAEIAAGADENSVRDVQPIMMALIDVARATGSAIVLIHHTNKAGSFRGSTVIANAGDALILVESKHGSNLVDFKSEKVRETGQFQFKAECHFEPDTFLLTPNTSTIPKQSLSKSKTYVIRYLTTHGESTLDDIKNNADTCSANAARQAVYDLASDGVVYRVNVGGQGSEAIYDLVNDPMATAMGSNGNQPEK